MGFFKHLFLFFRTIIFLNMFIHFNSRFLIQFLVLSLLVFHFLSILSDFIQFRFLISYICIKINFHTKEFEFVLSLIVNLFSDAISTIIFSDGINSIISINFLLIFITRKVLFSLSLKYSLSTIIFGFLGDFDTLSTSLIELDNTNSDINIFDNWYQTGVYLNFRFICTVGCKFFH